MKTMLSALALAAALGFAGNVAAADAKTTPMAGDAMTTTPDAMAAEPMAGDAMMTPEETLKACLEKAGMEADAMKKDEATKACNAATPMAGDAMGSDAMSATPMADDAMKPAQ